MSILREKKSTIEGNSSLSRETELPEGADYRGIAGKGSLVAEKPDLKQDAVDERHEHPDFPDETPLTRGI